MPTIDEVWDWINSYQQTIKECEAQIARLEPVYRQLGEIKNRFQSVRKSTEDVFEEKGKWSGERHTAFYSAGALLDNSCGEYYYRLDAAQDAVNSKIHELEAKKQEALPMIGKLFALIEEIKASIQNAWN